MEEDGGEEGLAGHCARKHPLFRALHKQQLILPTTNISPFEKALGNAALFSEQKQTSLGNRCVCTCMPYPCRKHKQPMRMVKLWVESYLSLLKSMELHSNSRFCCLCVKGWVMLRTAGQKAVGVSWQWWEMEQNKNCFANRKEGKCTWCFSIPSLSSEVSILALDNSASRLLKVVSLPTFFM